jgi:hypothetical protein
MSDAATRKLRDTEAGEKPGLRVSFSSEPPKQTPAARHKLTQLLLAKTVFETVLVAALAVGFYYFAFHPLFRGSVDVADPKRVEGWVVDASDTSARVEVQLYVDGRFMSSGYADQPRPDVRAAGWAPDELHGFRFSIKVDGRGEHEVRVYAVHSSAGATRRTLQQIGQPLRFSLSAE